MIDPTNWPSGWSPTGTSGVDAVELPGEFSRRGGICDVFPPDAADPVRLEFFGDEIESIRTFAAGSQRSLEKKAVRSSAERRATGQSPGGRRGPPHGLPPPDRGSSWSSRRPARSRASTSSSASPIRPGCSPPKRRSRNLLRLPERDRVRAAAAGVEASVHLRVESVERFSGNVNRVRDELDAVAAGDSACSSPARTRPRSIGSPTCSQAGQARRVDRLQLVTGHVRAGFRLVEAGVVVLGSHELFHQDQLPAGREGDRRSPAGGSSRGPSTASST